MTRIATSLPFTELEVATGNYDTSRATIDRIILHTMVGTWQGAAARFDDPASKVSAHYGIRLDGTLIHWLEETYTAYHAGNYAMNQRSIGLEHEDGGDFNGIRPDILYTESAKLVADICNFYTIPCDRDHIKKHNEVSDSPTGCPDALDIERIVREANLLLTPPPVTVQSQLDAKNKEYDELYAIDQNNLHTISQQKDVLNNQQALIEQKNANITTLNAEVQKKETELQARDQELSIVKPIATTVPALQEKVTAQQLLITQADEKIQGLRDEITRLTQSNAQLANTSAWIIPKQELIQIFIKRLVGAKQ